MTGSTRVLRHVLVIFSTLTLRCCTYRRKLDELIDIAQSSGRGLGTDHNASLVRAGVWAHGALSAKLWTWNSGKVDLSLEAARLAASPEDIIVTCQTEAESNIMGDLLGRHPWVLAGSAEHWGFAGGARNAQMLSVFVRQPEGLVLKAPEPSKVYGSEPSASLGHTKTTDWTQVYYTHAEKEHLEEWRTFMRIRTQVLRTDYKGKGGVSATLDFLSTPWRPATKITFLCAHLDSETPEARSDGLVTLMSSVRAPTDAGLRKRLRRRASKASSRFKKDGEKRQRPAPCAIWDTPETCSAAVEADDDTPEGVVMFGDLNFRLKSHGFTSLPVEQIVDWQARAIMSYLDYLNPQGNNPSELILPGTEDGYGFSCNEPYESSLPSYKRYAAEDCVRLGEIVQGCGKRGQEPCTESAKALAVKCYTEDGSANSTFDVKREDLQTGWLDRFCGRARGGADLHFQFDAQSEEAWATAPGKADKLGGSDHMPVASTVRFQRPGCRCEQLPAGASLTKCARVGSLDFGVEDVMSCKAGMQFAVAGGEARTGEPRDTIRVQCKPDGLLHTLETVFVQGAQPEEPVMPSPAVDVSQVTCGTGWYQVVDGGIS